MTEHASGDTAPSKGGSSTAVIVAVVFVLLGFLLLVGLGLGAAFFLKSKADVAEEGQESESAPIAAPAAPPAAPAAQPAAPAVQPAVPSGPPRPSWIVLAGAVPDESGARSRAAALAGKGFDADVLWIPDYGSLSGAAFWAVWIGPVAFDEPAQARRLLAAVRDEVPDAYSLKLADSGPRLELPEGPLPQLPSTPASPSFDCGAARTATEIALCSDGTLAALDREMASSYRSTRSRIDATANTGLRDQQRAWLKRRDRCPRRADMRTCLEGIYRDRIAELATW